MKNVLMLIVAINTLFYSQAFSQNKTWMREDYETNLTMEKLSFSLNPTSFNISWLGLN